QVELQDLNTPREWSDQRNWWLEAPACIVASHGRTDDRRRTETADETTRGCERTGAERRARRPRPRRVQESARRDRSDQDRRAADRGGAVRRTQTMTDGVG